MLRVVRVGLLTAVEWVLLLALWMAFVSQWSKAEFLFGILFATVGTIADAVVKEEGLAKFHPKASWVALIFWEPWYVLKGTYVTFKALLQEVAGRHPDSKFETAGYDTAGTDARSDAKRALAIAYLTIPPNSIIVGIDRDKKQILIHHIIPSPPSIMARKLGVKA